MDKTALEQLLSSYNLWMGLSTVAVAIGILGEYVAHFLFEEERRNKREVVVSILFGALVLGGVVGEYIFGKKLSQVSEQLQQIADTQVAQSNRDAAAARKDAEIAREDAEGFQAQIANANERAGKADERASTNEKEAARLRKDAEAERLARVKIEAKVGWRRLTDGQKAEIGTDLGDFSNQQGAALAYLAGDVEAGMFAIDVAEALKRAHIVVQPPADIMMMHEGGKFGDPIKRIDTGVDVTATKDDRSHSLADAVVRELNSLGFDATRGEDNPPKAELRPIIWIMVEPRPEGPQGEYKLQVEREAKTGK